MYTIEEYDKQKSRVLKYVLYKKRSKQEVKNKFYNDVEENMLEDIICELEENGYINDNNYIERAVNEFIALNNLSIKEIKYKLIANDILAYKEINGEFDIADFMTYINDLEYKEDIYRILNDYQDKILPEEFDNFVAIINKWIRESKIDKLKEQLKNETDVKKQEELNDLIIKIKKGSED